MGWKVKVVVVVGGDGGGARVGRDQRQLCPEVGADSVLLCLSALHVSRCRLLRLHGLLLLGDNHGFGDTVEFHSRTCRWVLRSSQVPSPATWNYGHNCRWRLGSIVPHASSSLLNSRCGGSSAALPCRMPSQILQQVPNICNHGLLVLVLVSGLVALQPLVVALLVKNCRQNK